MDVLFEFLPFLFVVWVLLRALRRKAAPAANVPSTPAPSGPRAPTPFEELVRRIEAAAAEAERQNAGEPRGVKPPPPLAAPTKRPRTSLPPRPVARATGEYAFRSLEGGPRSTEFRSLEAPASEPEFHPIYDLTPEEKALHESHRVVPGPAPSTRLPSSAPSTAPSPSPSRRRLHPLAAQLHTPEGARTAFLMREVMGERRGERRGFRH